MRVQRCVVAARDTSVKIVSVVRRGVSRHAFRESLRPLSSEEWPRCSIATR
jgi:hypothetical protein